MVAHKNHRHPMALQAEVRKKLFAEGKIDEHGNKIVKGGAAPPPPPPPTSKPSPNMLMSGMTVENKPLTSTPSPIVLSPREKLEALPDAEIIEKAKTLDLLKEGASREDLVNSLLVEGAEG